MVQRDNARAEIDTLKLKMEQLCFEKDQRITQLQEDLYEDRNDLKAKSIENLSLETAYEKQNKLVEELKKEIQMLNEKLEAHRKVRVLIDEWKEKYYGKPPKKQVEASLDESTSDIK